MAADEKRECARCSKLVRLQPNGELLLHPCPHGRDCRPPLSPGTPCNLCEPPMPAVRVVSVELSAEAYADIAEIMEPAKLLGRLVDAAIEGIRNPGSWHQQWLAGAFVCSGRPTTPTRVVLERPIGDISRRGH